jgi:AcrR family transcriptional regulator
MAAATSPLGKIRPGKQQRSERTLEAILDVAETLIAQKGYAATGVSEIAHRAGVTVGALYGRFDSKEALLQGLFERLCEQTLAVFDQLFDDLEKDNLGFRSALERSMKAMRWLYRERAALLRALNQAATTNPVLRKRLLTFNADICARLYRALDRYSDHICHPQPAMAMKLGHEAGMRLLRSSMLHEEIDYRDLNNEGIRVTDQLLVREAARIWEAYLKSRP